MVSQRQNKTKQQRQQQGSVSKAMESCEQTKPFPWALLGAWGLLPQLYPLSTFQLVFVLKLNRVKN